MDGLDTYEANGTELGDIAEYVGNISLNSRLKALLSSRPPPSFEGAFGERTRVKLHKLTLRNIITFI
jgi:hypothetical protein